jgi:hypothetical protein
MSKLIEHDIIQNIGIGAIALHHFTNKYFTEKKKLRGPDLALAMPVLPLLFHQHSLEQIIKRNFSGGFFKLVTEYRELPAGLQKRMESMADQTFKSLNLGYQSEILTYNKKLNQILPTKKRLSSNHYNSDIQEILRGAERLGYWFSGLPIDQICINLKIKF